MRPAATPYIPDFGPWKYWDSFDNGVFQVPSVEALRELKSEGLVRRTVIPRPPVRVSYELTDAGERTIAKDDEIGAVNAFQKIAKTGNISGQTGVAELVGDAVLFTST